MLMIKIEKWFTKSLCLCTVTLRTKVRNWSHNNNNILLLLFTAIEFSLGGSRPYTSNK